MDDFRGTWHATFMGVNEAVTGTETALAAGETLSGEMKKVLLLDDDAAFQDVVKDVLEASRYDVTAVRNGVEGVKEVMGSDFQIIVCDMNMPGLPGDMFYLAVERMKPRLCSRFIFVTGHKNDDKINDFVKRVRGTMLPKPFKVEDLLEMLAFVQVRSVVLG